jgi:hypothetical protein
MGAGDEGVAMAQSELSEEQQKKIALDLFLDAWDAACEAGVDADLLSETLIYLALTDLVADRGAEWTAGAVEDLPERIRDGEFTLARDDGEAERS